MMYNTSVSSCTCIIVTSLYNYITQTNPSIDIFHQSISTFKLKINQMLQFTDYPLPLPPPPLTSTSPYLPLPHHPLPTPTLVGPRVWKLVLILYAKFVLVNYLPICSEFVSVLFFNVFLMKYFYPFCYWRLRCWMC